MDVKIAIRKCTDVSSCIIQGFFWFLPVHILSNSEYVSVNVDGVPRAPTKMEAQYAFVFSFKVIHSCQRRGSKLLTRQKDDT